MNIKSLKRFFLFGLALVATVSFIGIRSFQFTPLQNGELSDNTKLNHVHSDAPVDQPFEIEDKEEQPETEDNETAEGTLSNPGFDTNTAGLQTDDCESANHPVISKSQAEHHAPCYVRLRSILI
jgi:hypothetical protein